MIVCITTMQQVGSMSYYCINLLVNTFHSSFDAKIIQFVMNTEVFSYLFCSLSHQVNIRTRKKSKYLIEHGLLQQIGSVFLFLSKIDTITNSKVSGKKKNPTCVKAKTSEHSQSFNRNGPFSLLTSLHPVSFSSCLSSRLALMPDERPPPRTACGHSGEGKHGRRRQPRVVSKRP